MWSIWKWEMKEKDRFFLGDIPVGFGYAVPGIEDDIIVACLDKDRDRVAGSGIEPSVGTKEGDLHIQDIGIH